jgi:AraC-like DNA-binding protein
MLFWYVRSILTDNPRLGKWDLLHFLPMVAFLAATIPYMLTPYSLKVEVAAKIVEDSMNLGKYNGTYIIFPVIVTYLSRPVLILGYTLWSAGLFIRYLLKKGKSSVLSRQHFMAKWLSVLLVLLFIWIFSHFIIFLEFFTWSDIKIFYTLNVLQVLSGTGLIGLLISPFFFPGILYGLPRVPQGLLTSEPDAAENDSSPEKTNKHLLSFESDYLHSIGRKADFCMNELHPYLQPNFNLFKLSVLIDIPVHHLAYYFREEKKQSFNDFRNEWRLTHAKRLIREGKASELTMEAIGLLSGFSSRNTFLIAFKKAEGIAPAVYAAQITI